LFRQRPESDERTSVPENVSWANAKLEEARQRALGLQQALTTQGVGAPGSAARTRIVEQCLGELGGLESDLLAIQAALGANQDVTAALEAVERDKARFEPFIGVADPPGIGPDTTWAEAFRQGDIRSYAQALVAEISTQVQPGSDDPLATLFRADGPYQAAQDFAKVELRPRIDELMAVATRFATQAGDETMATRFPDFEYRTEDPPPGFQFVIRDLIQDLVPVLFPPDASAVTGDLFNLLVSVYAEVRESLGDDLGPAAMRVTLVDVLFLRGQLHTLASFAASLPRGTLACEALTRTVAILMTAANGSGPGKIPAGYHPPLEAVHFYVDSFMKSMLARLAAAAAAAASLATAPSPGPAASP
jgi:hypothetical protein